MYKDYFGLLDEPFRMTPDTRYLYKSHRYEEALASLVYGIKEKKGFIVITGEIGTGKTTLCRSLLNQLDTETKTAVILNPGLSKVELLHAILDDLNVETKTKNPTQKALLDALNIYLIEQARAGANVAVIVDEAQNLEHEVLESIRMLSNLETEQEKLLQIILVGQPELNEVLKMPKMEQLRQRIAVRYHITPLDRDEIPRYIKHRLQVAGNEKCVEFQPAAVEAIAKYTRGTPRLINIICDKCLLAAYATQTKVVDGELALRAIEDHEGPAAKSSVAPEAPAFAPAPHKGGKTWFPAGRRADWRPLIAATTIAAIVLFVGLATRKDRGAEGTAAVPTPVSATPVSATPAPAAPVSVEPAVPAANEPPAASTLSSGTTLAQIVGEARAAGPASSAPAFHEILRLWGLPGRPDAATLEAAGMTAVPLVTDLATLARIDLPALVAEGGRERALVGASTARFTFMDPQADARANPARQVEVARAAQNELLLVNARIPLPAHWTLPTDPVGDPRLPRLLAAALRRPPGTVRADRAAILQFQRASGLPADGIIGPLTWCALVARAHPGYPRLSS